MDQDDQRGRYPARIRRVSGPGLAFSGSWSKSLTDTQFAPIFAESGEFHAAEPPTARPAARRIARARRGEIRRGLVLREVRRYPRAGDRDLGRPAAALAQG